MATSICLDSYGLISSASELKVKPKRLDHPNCDLPCFEVALKQHAHLKMGLAPLPVIISGDFIRYLQSKVSM